MNTETRARLLQLNRDFYAAVAAPFHETRKAWSPGKARLLTMLPHVGDRPLRVLDVGCGNGRLARMLDSLARPIIYTGVDGDAALLAFADEQTRDLAHVSCTFVRADLADPAWAQSAGIDRDYDVTLCLATLQHLPGTELRAATVATLARLTALDGLIILSGWQFLESPPGRQGTGLGRGRRGPGCRRSGRRAPAVAAGRLRGALRAPDRRSRDGAAGGPRRFGRDHELSRRRQGRQPQPVRPVAEAGTGPIIGRFNEVIHTHGVAPCPLKTTRGTGNDRN
ncbi:MAG: class I SAM-dependent methyltransferase [Caldilineaceae bacterium]